MGVATEVLEDLRWPAKRPFRIDHPGRGPQRRDEPANRARSASGAVPAAKVRSPCAKAAWKPVRFLARKTIASAVTGNRNVARPRIQRVRSRDKAPLVTTQWTCSTAWISGRSRSTRGTRTSRQRWCTYTWSRNCATRRAKSSRHPSSPIGQARHEKISVTLRVIEVTIAVS